MEGERGAQAQALQSQGQAVEQLQAQGAVAVLTIRQQEQELAALRQELGVLQQAEKHAEEVRGELAVLQAEQQRNYTSIAGLNAELAMGSREAQHAEWLAQVERTQAAEALAQQQVGTTALETNLSQLTTEMQTKQHRDKLVAQRVQMEGERGVFEQAQKEAGVSERVMKHFEVEPGQAGLDLVGVLGPDQIVHWHGDGQFDSLVPQSVRLMHRAEAGVFHVHVGWFLVHHRERTIWEQHTIKPEWRPKTAVGHVECLGLYVVHQFARR